MGVACAAILLFVVSGCLACGPPPSVSHATASKSTMSTSSGDSLQIATYQCNSTDGYATRGNNTIACLSMLGYSIWTSVQVSCVRVRCNSAPYMDQATSDYTIFLQRSRHVQRYRYDYYYVSHYYYSERRSRQYAFYAVDYYNVEERKTVYYTGHVTFTCNTNYFLPNGSQAIRTYCGDDGRWIEPNATCQGKDCGELSGLEGVTCTGGSTRFPNRKLCRCITGYERVNNQSSFTISCLASGTWSNPTDGRPAYCTRVVCGTPPTINNSDSRATVGRGTRYGDRVTYTCLPGYEARSGSYSIQCQANRRWTDAPTCIKKDCGHPPDVENGRIQRELYNTTFESEVKYSCNSPQYDMAGSAMITCQEDGVWSAAPICYEIKCGPPPHVPNSERHVFGHSVNDTVMYECDAGYTMIGNRSISCQIYGHWTLAPECEGLPCGVPPQVENAENLATPSSPTVGSEARYTCITGYQMMGESVIECLPNQQWSTLPQCNKVDCGWPAHIPHSKINGFGKWFNDTIDYQCEPGYNLAGNHIISCQADGRWTESPACEELSCGQPPEVENAKNSTIVGGATVGSEAKYTCVTGYQMKGESVIECLPNQQWSTLPQCNKIICGPPPYVPNSRKQILGFKFNESTTYECDDGYKLVGNGSILCQASGHWSLPPDCEELSCGDPPEVENAENSTIVTGTTVGSEARYACITGYQMKGESVIECLPNQQWSTLPQCSRIRCGNPPQVPNGVRRVYGHYLNDATKYRCHTGYNLVGNVFIRCQPDGHWSVPPECHVVSCGIPLASGFAVVTSFTGVQFGNTAYYHCLPGYNTEHLAFSICQLNGTWSRPPRCVANPTEGITMVPSTTTERSTSPQDELPTTTETTTTATEPVAKTRPDTTVFLPTTTDGSPTMTQLSPTSEKSLSIATKELSTATESLAAYAESSPTTKESSPTSVKSSSVFAESSSTTTKPETFSTENSPTSTKSSSTNTENLQTTTESSPAIKEGPPTTTEKLLIFAEFSTIATETSTTATETSPTPTESSPTTTETSPTTAETSPASIKGSTEFQTLLRTFTNSPTIFSSAATFPTSIKQSSKSSTASSPPTGAFKPTEPLTEDGSRSIQPTDNVALKMTTPSTMLKSQLTSSDADLPTYTTTKNPKAENTENEHKAEHPAQSPIQNEILIGCTVAIGTASIVLVVAAWCIRKKRRTREHNFIPASNALFDTESTSMTVYSFKGGRDSSSL